MNCELYDDVLDEYVEGARASDGPGAIHPRLAAFETHLAGCPRCQAVVADFTNIRRQAAALDEPLPPARLWARIASSVEDQQRKPWWERSFANTFSAWVPMAVAASLALLIGSTAWLVWYQADVNPPVNGAAPVAAPEIAVAEEHYEQAIAGLEQIADAQNPDLDPQTRAVLRENLAVIDRAISESRAALAVEPASALAQDSLLDALDTKVALLQDTVTLASDIGAESPDNPPGQGINQ